MELLRVRDAAARDRHRLGGTRRARFMLAVGQRRLCKGALDRVDVGEVVTPEVLLGHAVRTAVRVSLGPRRARSAVGWGRRRGRPRRGVGRRRAHCFGTRRGISRPSFASPVYAASAKLLCSIQSKEKSGSVCTACGVRKLAEWLLSSRIVVRNSSARAFSASVVGSHGGKKTVWVWPIPGCERPGNPDAACSHAVQALLRGCVAKTKGFLSGDNGRT